MKHTEWLDQTTRHGQLREVARAAGIAYSTLQNQARRDHLSAETVIRVAETYNHSPVRALVQTGYIAPVWAETVDPRTALRRVTDTELADEVLERMERGTAGVLAEPIDEVSARRQSNGQGRPRPPVEDDGTVTEWNRAAGTYAADSSADEDARREEQGNEPID